MRITKRWTETEHSLMRQHYSLPDGVEFLMSALKRDRPSLWIKAQRLGLTHYVYILRGGKADKRKLAITVENLKMNTIIDPIKGCWLWTGPCYGTGYGSLTINRKSHLAHMLMFAAA